MSESTNKSVNPPRPIRVIKRDPKREEYKQRHELSMLRLLIEEHLEEAQDIVRQIVVDNNQLVT